MRLSTSVALLALLGTFGVAAPSLAAVTTYSMRVPSLGLRPAPPTAAPVSGGTFQFTTCGATGAYGPTTGQCTSAYSGSALAGSVSVAAGIQSWTVPTTGVYTITLAGGAGGTTTGSPRSGGAGAVLTTKTTLTAGWQLSILVGQAGIGGVDDAGGGGASYLVSRSTLLANAGGGGGGGNAGDSGYAASTTTASTSHRGSGNGWGGGGSGFDTNGYNDINAARVYGGQSYNYLSGGTGGGASTNSCGVSKQAQGGFGGGGGGGCDGGGSGGGYTISSQGGAGGTTYSSGTIVSSVANNPGAGYVTISKD